jgi:hypothetical protein
MYPICIYGLMVFFVEWNNVLLYNIISFYIKNKNISIYIAKGRVRGQYLRSSKKDFFFFFERLY